MKSLLLVFPVVAMAQPTTWQPEQPPKGVSVEHFKVPKGLEVTVWAQSPMFYNPTNIDIDHAGRIWVAEGVNYRTHVDRRPAGDRIMVLQDTNGDGKADQSHVFVQEKSMIAPLGVTVLDNQIIVPQPPHLVIFTDVNRNLVFDKGDTREEFLTGFDAQNHDHALHALIVGPDGKWHLNNGNCGAIFTDKDGKTFRMRSPYRGGQGNYLYEAHLNPEIPSDDGHHYNAGFIARMNPDGTGTEIISQGLRNSYEHCINSFGEVFQSDNDDPPACRVSYALEYGDAGFFSKDGKRIWSVEVRPGQRTQIAHWRQESPGFMDAGDVYGHGSPTGIMFYENGALGKDFRGTLLACEPGRNLIFSYKPEVCGGAYKLKRRTFLSTGINQYTSNGHNIKAKGDALSRLRFRPSDICVGPDGALYCSDWYDRRVGGHADLDDSCSGTIYRIAPKGFQSVVPKIDINTLEGALTALKSPAVNVRAMGFIYLKKHGAEALPPLLDLLKDKNPYLAARAIWLLPHLGPDGLTQVRNLLKSPTERFRLTAFRALRATGHADLTTIRSLTRDPSPAIRRDVALALRERPITESQDILLEVYRQWDGQDHNTLEAIGIAAIKNEGAFYHFATTQLSPGDPLKWNQKFVKLTWRLKPPAAVPHLLRRAQHSEFDHATRKFALESIGFIESPGAMEAMIELSKDAKLGDLAKWWLKNRAFGPWDSFGAKDYIVKAGIFDPNAPIIESIIPDQEQPMDPKKVLSLTGDPEKGKVTITRCYMCHQVGEQGVNYGPNLTHWGKNQELETIIRAITHPSDDIAHGFNAWEMISTDDKKVHGRILNKNDFELTIQSQGGVTQTILRKRVRKIQLLGRKSLMLSANQLGLTPQEVADIAAFLKGKG